MSAEIEEGHGKTDVSCRHGSRWMWWPGPDGKGAWKQVVRASNCDCSDPPRPDKKEAEGPGTSSLGLEMGLSDKKEAGYVMLEEDEDEPPEEDEPLDDELEDLDEDADDYDEAEDEEG